MPEKDSNLRYLRQRKGCCHYTIRQLFGGKSRSRTQPIFLQDLVFKASRRTIPAASLSICLVRHRRFELRLAAWQATVLPLNTSYALFGIPSKNRTQSARVWNPARYLICMRYCLATVMRIELILGGSKPRQLRLCAPHQFGGRCRIRTYGPG